MIFYKYAKRCLLFFILTALIPQLVWGQEAIDSIRQEKVNYSRRFPLKLRDYLPKDGTSRFWGASKLKYKGQTIWVHVYDVAKMDFSIVPFSGFQTSGLDLFTYSNHHLKRISSTHFSYVRGGYEEAPTFETVGLSTFWLDPKLQKVPIIKVNIENPNGFLGQIGREILFVFQAGFDRPIVQQGFGYGASNSGGMNSWETKYGGVDEKGRIVVVFDRDWPEAWQKTTYKWVGDSFKEFETTSGTS